MFHVEHEITIFLAFIFLGKCIYIIFLLYIYFYIIDIMFHVEHKIIYWKLIAINILIYNLKYW